MHGPMIFLMVAQLLATEDCMAGCGLFSDDRWRGSKK